MTTKMRKSCYWISSKYSTHYKICILYLVTSLFKWQTENVRKLSQIFLWLFHPFQCLRQVLNLQRRYLLDDPWWKSIWSNLQKWYVILKILHNFRTDKESDEEFLTEDSWSFIATLLCHRQWYGSFIDDSSEDCQCMSVSMILSCIQVCTLARIV